MIKLQQQQANIFRDLSGFVFLWIFAPLSKNFRFFLLRGLHFDRCRQPDRAIGKYRRRPAFAGNLRAPSEIFRVPEFDRHIVSVSDAVPAGPTGRKEMEVELENLTSALFEEANTVSNKYRVCSLHLLTYIRW